MISVYFFFLFLISIFTICSLSRVSQRHLKHNYIQNLLLFLVWLAANLPEDSHYYNSTKEKLDRLESLEKDSLSAYCEYLDQCNYKTLSMLDRCSDKVNCSLRFGDKVVENKYLDQFMKHLKKLS